jgi:hypothetical protein
MPPTERVAESMRAKAALVHDRTCCHRLDQCQGYEAILEAVRAGYELCVSMVSTTVSDAVGRAGGVAAVDTVNVRALEPPPPAALPKTSHQLLAEAIDRAAPSLPSAPARRTTDRLARRLARHAARRWRITP